MSSLAADIEMANTPSTSLIDQAIDMCAVNVVGILAVEVWKFCPINGTLFPVRPMRVLRVPEEADPNSARADPKAIEAYEKVMSWKPTALSVGSGLPGVLWSESGHHKRKTTKQRATQRLGSIQRRATQRRATGTSALPSSFQNIDGEGTFSELTWREVDQIAEDPYQASEERLDALPKAGFRLAASAHFRYPGYHCLVIYYGNPHMTRSKIRSTENSRFLSSSTHLIGAAALNQVPNEKAAAHKARVLQHNWIAIRTKMLWTMKCKGKLTKEKPEPELKMASAAHSYSGEKASLEIGDSAYSEGTSIGYIAADLKLKAIRWTKKIQGGGSDIPPKASWIESALTFFGVFISISIISLLHMVTMRESEREFAFQVAPLVAFAAIQYSLTAAPPAQPRNAFFGQLLCATCAICLSYIPMPKWLRPVLAGAITIPLMAKLGIPHPPGAATAVIFSAPKDNAWTLMAINQAGYCVLIITGVMINNLSIKRQYPTNWYLLSKAKKWLFPEKETKQS